MKDYLADRSKLFNAWSAFSCPDSCERMGCKRPDLHISISLVDLVAISLISGCKAAELFREDVKIGFDPLYENEPWIGRIYLELKRPCHFLDAKECLVYLKRPIACALFPEYYFISEPPERILQKDIFQAFPCIQKPRSISPQRKAILQQLSEMSAKEAFLSDFYLFGISPFVIDLKSIAGEGLEGIPVSENGKALLPHRRIEELLSHRFRGGGYLWDWEAKIEKLDRVDGPESLIRMKLWTDQMAMVTDRSSLNIVYQFDGKQLLPIRHCK
jgi:Fe-S-cluster containining protein